MLRVTGGTWRGRRLATPKGQETRPTADRVREALFSILAGLLDYEGATVLDLFAGSGALGIEALSRGAGQVLFVEAHARTAALVRHNLAELDVPAADGRVVVARAEAWLRQRSQSRPSQSRPSQSRPSQSRPSQSRPSQSRPPGPELAAPAALVLADPPYAYGERGQYAALLQALAASAAVAQDAWIVLETRAGAELTLPEQLESERVKRYGDTQLCILSRRTVD